MGIFKAREPRKFRRVTVYSDERKDRLRRLVEEVKREQGEIEAKVEEDRFNPDRFRGKFQEFTPRAQKHRESKTRLGLPLVMVLLLALFLVWRFLLTGSTRF